MDFDTASTLQWFLTWNSVRTPLVPKIRRLKVGQFETQFNIAQLTISQKYRGKSGISPPLKKACIAAGLSIIANVFAPPRYRPKYQYAYGMTRNTLTVSGH